MSCLPSLNLIAGKYSSRWGILDDEIQRLDFSNSQAKAEVPDRCKTLCESVLKEILLLSDTKNEAEVDSMNIPQLTGLVCNVLNFNSEENTLLKAESEYLSRVRNVAGTVGHGFGLRRQAALRATVDTDQTQRILSVTDSLLTMLVVQFERQFPEESVTIERNESYDEYIDTLYGAIEIEGTEYSASEILFYVNEKSYKRGLDDFLKNLNK